MWYIGHSKSEYYKPLSLLTEYLAIMTFAKVYGVSFSLMFMIIAYVAIMVLFYISGILLVKFGIIKYNTRLANTQNPELLKIKKDVQYIKSRLK
jgi:hypothetical protein